MPRIDKSSRPTAPKIEMIDPRAWHAAARHGRCATRLDDHERDMLDLTGHCPEIVRVTLTRPSRGMDMPRWWPGY